MKDVGWDGGSVCVLGIVWRGGERWGGVVAFRIGNAWLGIHGRNEEL